MNIAEELENKGFEIEVEKNFTNYRKGNLLFRKHQNTGNSSFKASSDCMVIHFIKMNQDSFEAFQEEAFSRFKELFELMKEIVNSDWGKHDKKENLLTWMLFNGATFSAPYEGCGGKLRMRANLKIGKGELETSFDMSGNDYGVIDFMIDTDYSHLGLCFLLDNKKIKPSALEKKMKKLLKDEFDKCNDAMNGIL